MINKVDLEDSYFFSFASRSRQMVISSLSLLKLFYFVDLHVFQLVLGF